MTDKIPEAIVTRKSRFSVVWLIPLVALAIGGWLTFKYLHEKGPQITIEFSSANGLAAGKTKIRYKDVEVGVVNEIDFGPDLETVIVTATLNSEMRKYLDAKTRFWVVRARVAAGEVSGLGTLLSGAYIAIEPGGGDGGKAKVRSFKALDSPPAVLSGENGSKFHLHSGYLYSFDIGAPVYYRRLKVGEIIDYKLDEQGTAFDIEVFVKSPYNRLVRTTTRFWNASGVNVKLDADGFELQTESIISLLLGGISFDDLEQENGSQAEPGTQFELYSSKDVAASVEYESGSRYRVYFEESARGLKAGAPVTLRGITIGFVTDVGLNYDMRDMTFKIPVTIELKPKGLTIVGRQHMDTELPAIEELVAQGLRAQLRPGNLLTGQQLIDFDIYPDAEPARVVDESGIKVLPTIPTKIGEIMQGLRGVLDKFNEMPLDEIGINLNGVLAGINKLVNSDDATDTLANIKMATQQLNTTLAEAEAVAAGLNEESDAYQELIKTMHELSGAARSLRQMAEYLERHPESLLKGKPR